jgi:hypothetical protein
MISCRIAFFLSLAIHKRGILCFSLSVTYYCREVGHSVEFVHKLALNGGVDVEHQQSSMVALILSPL